MDDEQRAEYEALMAVACGDPDNGGKPTRVMAVRLHDLLVDAERAGRPWAARCIDEDALAGHMERCKQWLKKQSIVLFSHDGKVIGKATRVGSRRRDKGGAAVWQQKLIHDMTWDEVREWLDDIERQLGGLIVNKAMARRLLALAAKCPQSSGPAEACASMGVTVEAFLAEAA